MQIKATSTTETRMAGWKMDLDWRCVCYWKWKVSIATLFYRSGTKKLESTTWIYCRSLDGATAGFAGKTLEAKSLCKFDLSRNFGSQAFRTVSTFSKSAAPGLSPKDCPMRARASCLSARYLWNSSFPFCSTDAKARVTSEWTTAPMRPIQDAVCVDVVTKSSLFKDVSPWTNASPAV